MGWNNIVGVDGMDSHAADAATHPMPAYTLAILVYPFSVPPLTNGQKRDKLIHNCMFHF